MCGGIYGDITKNSDYDTLVCVVNCVSGNCACNYQYVHIAYDV